jgi:hypothetical protein
MAKEKFVFRPGRFYDKDGKPLSEEDMRKRHEDRMRREAIQHDYPVTGEHPHGKTGSVPIRDTITSPGRVLNDMMDELSRKPVDKR